jgi:hypothetical protein
MGIARCLALFSATGLADLRDILAGDCPPGRAGAYHDRCAVQYLQLVPLFMASER